MRNDTKTTAESLVEEEILDNRVTLGRLGGTNQRYLLSWEVFSSRKKAL